MDLQRDSATHAIKVDASGRRETEVVAAAQVQSIDYQPIIEQAVAGLSDNTRHNRGEVYEQARTVVKRHLQLMRLPEPIVELEALAVDRVIEKIERRWQAQELAQELVRERLRENTPETAEEVAEEEFVERTVSLDPPKRRVERPEIATPPTVASLLRTREHIPETAEEVAEEEFIERAVSLDSRKRRVERPEIATPPTVASLLRSVAKPIGVAAALPIVATILFGLYADGKVIYRSLVDSLAERWLLDTGGEPSAAIPGDRGSVVVAAARTANAVTSDAPAMATMTAECDSGSSMSERNACAHDPGGGGTVAETPKSDAGPPWLGSLTALSDITSGRAPSSMPTVPTIEGVPAHSAVPFGLRELQGAASAMPPGYATRATPLQASRAGAIKPTDTKVTALIQTGKQAVTRDDFERAVHDFSEAIRIDPKYPDGYSERGQTLFKLGEIERAIADYSAALARDPEHTVTLRARATAYLYRGKADLALADLSKTIELAERDPRLLAPVELFYARRSRGSIYDSKQQYDLEIADCTSIIESHAHDPILADALVANYGSAGAANMLAMIYRQRANAFLRKSDFERAIADLTEAIPLSSDQGYAALVDRSKLHEGLGRRDLATADARAALSIRPGSEEARLALNRLSGSSKPAPPGRL